jgi:sucrose-6-phosphate hydrolase SacC (GH32 family)
MLYDEPYRPQFHFTAPRSWINDPNGLIYFDGEYHLMYQCNPGSREPHWDTEGLIAWWGHAVSTDLVHWEHLPLTSIHDGSGSGVVDVGNTAGFGSGDEDVLLAFHGRDVSYSRDRGRTWTAYEGNPVLPGRWDPHVFRHEPTGQWILVSFVDNPDRCLFYRSDDLRHWNPTSGYDGLHECPVLFELPVEGEAARKWVLHPASGEYRIGTFNGERFHEESCGARLDYGDFYAAHLWHGRSPGDGRTIQIAWMNEGAFPAEMPFNQQLTFPYEVTLRRLPEGLRVCRRPVREIAHLVDRVVTACDDVTLRPGENLLQGVEGDLYDLDIDADLEGTGRLVLTLRGERVVYDPAAETLQCGPRSAPLRLPSRRLRLRVLLDRASIEVFADHGQIAIAHCFFPEPGDRALALETQGGNARVRRLRVRSLRSAWRSRGESQSFAGTQWA